LRENIDINALLTNQSSAGKTKIKQIKNDSIYVINRDDELIVKRIQDLWNGQMKIKSDNPKL